MKWNDSVGNARNKTKVFDTTNTYCIHFLCKNYFEGSFIEK